MNKKFLSALIVAAAFIFASGQAAQAGHCSCDKIAHKMHKIIDKLNLTSEQKEKIKSIRDKAHTVIKGKHDEMKSIEIMVNAAYKDGSMTEAKIDEYTNKKVQVIGAVIKTRMMERLEISNILTTEQKQEIDKIANNWLKKHHDKHEKMCHGL